MQPAVDRRFAGRLMIRKACRPPSPRLGAEPRALPVSVPVRLSESIACLSIPISSSICCIADTSRALAPAAGGTSASSTLLSRSRATIRGPGSFHSNLCADSRDRNSSPFPSVGRAGMIVGFHGAVWVGPPGPSPFSCARPVDPDHWRPRRLSPSSGASWRLAAAIAGSQSGVQSSGPSCT
jgi:hypothetical protein